MKAVHRSSLSARQMAFARHEIDAAWICMPVLIAGRPRETSRAERRRDGHRVKCLPGRVSERREPPPPPHASHMDCATGVRRNVTRNSGPPAAAATAPSRRRPQLAHRRLLQVRSSEPDGRCVRLQLASDGSEKDESLFREIERCARGARVCENLTLREVPSDVCGRRARAKPPPDGY